MNLCKHKDVLGKPKQGIHSYRMFGVAIADVIMTILGAYIISIYFGYRFIYVLGGLFLLGIILHRLFCVNTTINKWLFGVL
jgi:hypothetical protein